MDQCRALTSLGDGDTEGQTLVQMSWYAVFYASNCSFII
jgi:hypothetical protein